MSQQGQKLILVISDAGGDTAEAVAKATIRQFAAEHVRIKRYGKIKHKDEIRTIIQEASQYGGLIVYTLVQAELREAMREGTSRLGIHAVDVMGPMMQAFTETFNDSLENIPIVSNEMDESYYRKIEAIEYAVKYDDGKDARGLLMAQVVLIGVSRTSKTPLSIYLAHQGIKTANYPLTIEVMPPQELFMAGNQLMVGVTMKPERLMKIRSERLKALGLPSEANYASYERVEKELQFASDIMKRLNCPVIDVSEKSIEETAEIIMELLEAGKEQINP